MHKSVYQVSCQQLQQLMDKVGCASLPELSQLSGLSSWQLQRVRHGLLANLSAADLVKLANALQVPVHELLTRFGFSTIPVEDRSSELTALQKEYQTLQQKLDRQPEELAREFQRTSLATIESWLVQWPTAEAVARKNPQLSAVNILALLKPFQQLLQRWGVEPIHSVGEQVPYEPRIHQLIDGTADVETPVLVRYIGYRHGDKLLHRAQVSLITVEVEETETPERLPVNRDL
jgi:molecular chaperone GrpE (heat shock protein)